MLNTALQAVRNMAETSRMSLNVCRSVVLIMLLASLTPLIAPVMETVTDNTEPTQLPITELKLRDATLTGARAPCPTVQTDGGTAGDAGNTTATAKSQGSDPTVLDLDGCIDTSDTEDWYGLQISANKDVVVILRDFGDGTTIDFDLVVSDSTGGNQQTGTGYVGLSLTYATSERVEFTTNASNAGMHYIQIWQYNGDGSYKLDFWVNNSVPKPDLSVNNITGPATAMAGDTVNVTYTVDNFGPGELNSTNQYDVVFILSQDTTYDWSDTIVDSQISGPQLTAGTSQTVTSSVVIPSEMDSDDYYWIVWPDGWGNVTEADELNNNNASVNLMTITAMPCAVIDDASTGADIGEVEADAHDLGNGFSGIITGCVSGDDKGDLYKLSMERGQNITAVLTADNWDTDIDLDLWNSSSPDIDSSFSPNSNETVSTSGTDADGAADTYFINVTQFSGLANYTLQIWTNGTPYVPPFDCGPDNDWNSGSDAGSDAIYSISVGENPVNVGMGCVDPEDQTDTFAFTLSGMNGVEITLGQPEGMDMHLVLYDGATVLIDENMPNASSVSLNTSDIDHLDLDGAYTVRVLANGGEGWYNLTFTNIAPPQPDLVPSEVNCPTTAPGTELLTGSDVWVGAEGSSINGPTTADFSWNLWLVAENGTQVLEILNGSYSDSLSGFDGVIITKGDWVMLDHTIPTGNYTCVMTIDSGMTVAESNETNNQLISDPFFLQNYDELWADDTDRDGVLNDDDACPNTPGDSTEDRLGCQDVDRDGWSNAGDYFIYEPSQWADLDGDGFGDNLSGVNGDVCPNEAGVATGTNGTGCPIWYPDSDNDGIIDQNDACPGTAAGVVVDALGCAVDDGGDGGDGGDGTGDGTGDGGDGTGDGGDGTGDGGDGTGDGTDDGDDGGDDETSDKAGSNNVLYIIGGLAVLVALIVVLLATLLIVRGRGRGGDATEDAWSNSISPEQQQYEQQLVAMGYTSEQARAYASQYFE